MIPHTFNWEEILYTGHTVIDNQHRKLVDLLNSLITAYSLSNEKALITKILFELEDYAHFHFLEEETLLSRMEHYPTHEHLKEHKEFTRRINELKFDYVSDNRMVVPELIDFLKNWIKNHILGIDKVELTALLRYEVGLEVS